VSGLPSRTPRISRTLVAVVLGTVTVLGLASSVSADGGDDDDEVRLSGSCKAGSGWEMRAKTDSDGRIELRGRVESSGAGQRWNWKVKHNGSVSASGSAVTAGESASFEVRRDLVDLAGVDLCTFRAVRPRTGEVCRGTIRW
jgi:hypothetical protein